MNAWTAKVSHALDEVKDQDVGFTALKHIINEAKSQYGVRKVFLFTDGGRADFKCAQFVHSLFSIQEQTNVEINHIVMAPYHGHGSADAAKAQASRKLKNWFMNEHEIYHSLDTIRNVFNDFSNHRVLDLAPLWARPLCGKLHGVADYYQFYFDVELGHIYANFKATIEGVVDADKTWDTVLKGRKKIKNYKFG